MRTFTIDGQEYELVELTILSEFPIVLTKDPSWKPRTPAKEGAIILLPKDAVLVIPKPNAPLSNLEGR